MAFPNEPLIASPYAVPTVDPTVFPVPTWATSTTAPPGIAVKADPGADKRAVGWAKASPSVDYGEAPPFAWENHERYINGQWATYFKAVADYIKSGALAPSVAILSKVNFQTIGPGVNNRMNFDSNQYYNYTGYPVWDFGAQQLLVPYAGLCRCTLSFNLTITAFPTFIYSARIQFIRSGTVICEQDFTNFLDGAIATPLAINASCLFEVGASDAVTVAIENTSSYTYGYQGPTNPLVSFSFSRTTPF